MMPTRRRAKVGSTIQNVFLFFSFSFALDARITEPPQKVIRLVASLEFRAPQPAEEQYEVLFSAGDFGGEEAADERVGLAFWIFWVFF